MQKKDISVLDVTIRDGSYAIDYQYTPGQIASIVSELDAAGIDYIEVCHGCGLGARDNLGLPAAASDVEYVLAAKGVAKRSKIGVIAGPSPVTKPKDIDSVLGELDFIRFAANCDKPQIVEDNIKYVRKRHARLPTFLQLMRSNRRPKKDIVAAAKVVEAMGVDTLYLVDTAGHYTPEDVRDIIGAMRDKLNIAVGFHGHNNLSLAVANTLAAVDAGAVSIDASLKGIGRAGGNAQLEVLISLLNRKGLAQRINLDRLIAAGEELVGPLMPPSRGIAGVDIITADANIDLYPLAVYEKVAQLGEISLTELVRALASDKSLVEAGPGEIARALNKLGIDHSRVFAALGWKNQ